MGMSEVTYNAFLLYELEPKEYQLTLGTFKSFENQINNTIDCGEKLLQLIS